MSSQGATEDGGLPSVSSCVGDFRLSLNRLKHALTNNRLEHLHMEKIQSMRAMLSTLHAAASTNTWVAPTMAADFSRGLGMLTELEEMQKEGRFGQGADIGGAADAEAEDDEYQPGFRGSTYSSQPSYGSGHYGGGGYRSSSGGAGAAGAKVSDALLAAQHALALLVVHYCGALQLQLSRCESELSKRDVMVESNEAQLLQMAAEKAALLSEKTRLAAEVTQQAEILGLMYSVFTNALGNAAAAATSGASSPEQQQQQDQGGAHPSTSRGSLTVRQLDDALAAAAAASANQASGTMSFLQSPRALQMLQEVRDRAQALNCGYFSAPNTARVCMPAAALTAPPPSTQQPVDEAAEAESAEFGRDSVDGVGIASSSGAATSTAETAGAAAGDGKRPVVPPLPLKNLTNMVQQLQQVPGGSAASTPHASAGGTGVKGETKAGTTEKGVTAAVAAEDASTSTDAQAARGIDAATSARTWEPAAPPAATEKAAATSTASVGTDARSIADAGTCTDGGAAAGVRSDRKGVDEAPSSTGAAASKSGTAPPLQQPAQPLAGAVPWTFVAAMAARKLAHMSVTGGAATTGSAAGDGRGSVMCQASAASGDAASLGTGLQGGAGTLHDSRRSKAPAAGASSAASSATSSGSSGTSAGSGDEAVRALLQGVVELDKGASQVWEGSVRLVRGAWSFAFAALAVAGSVLMPRHTASPVL